MQTQRRAVRVFDRIAGIGMLFLVSFLFFLFRLEHLIYALIFALGFSALLAYGLYLLSRRSQTRSSTKEMGRKQADSMRHAYSMLPPERALRLAADQLCKKYALSLRGLNADLAFALDAQKKLIAIGLAQSPAQVTVNTAYDFHKKRLKMPAVLLTVGEPSRDALRYAKELTPPIRLMEVTELPHEESIAAQFERAAEHKSGLRAALAHAIDRITLPQQAVRYMALAAVLSTWFILTDSSLALIPAMLSALLALIARRRLPAQPQLFQNDL